MLFAEIAHLPTEIMSFCGSHNKNKGVKDAASLPWSSRFREISLLPKWLWELVKGVIMRVEQFPFEWDDEKAKTEFFEASSGF